MKLFYVLLLFTMLLQSCSTSDSEESSSQKDSGFLKSAKKNVSTKNFEGIWGLEGEGHNSAVIFYISPTGFNLVSYPDFMVGGPSDSIQYKGNSFFVQNISSVSSFSISGQLEKEVLTLTYKTFGTSNPKEKTFTLVRLP